MMTVCVGKPSLLVFTFCFCVVAWLTTSLAAVGETSTEAKDAVLTDMPKSLRGLVSLEAKGMDTTLELA